MRSGNASQIANLAVCASLSEGASKRRGKGGADRSSCSLSLISEIIRQAGDEMRSDGEIQICALS